jgi:hypothetical protein
MSNGQLIWPIVIINITMSILKAAINASGGWLALRSRGVWLEGVMLNIQ